MATPGSADHAQSSRPLEVSPASERQMLIEARKKLQKQVTDMEQHAENQRGRFNAYQQLHAKRLDWLTAFFKTDMVLLDIWHNWNAQFDKIVGLVVALDKSSEEQPQEQAEEVVVPDEDRAYLNQMTAGSSSSATMRTNPHAASLMFRREGGYNKKNVCDLLRGKILTTPRKIFAELRMGMEESLHQSTTQQELGASSTAVTTKTVDRLYPADNIWRLDNWLTVDAPEASSKLHSAIQKTTDIWLKEKGPVFWEKWTAFQKAAQGLLGKARELQTAERALLDVEVRGRKYAEILQLPEDDPYEVQRALEKALGEKSRALRDAQWKSDKHIMLLEESLQRRGKEVEKYALLEVNMQYELQAAAAKVSAYEQELRTHRRNAEAVRQRDLDVEEFEVTKLRKSALEDDLARENDRKNVLVDKLHDSEQEKKMLEQRVAELTRKLERKAKLDDVDAHLESIGFGQCEICCDAYVAQDVNQRPMCFSCGHGACASCVDLLRGCGRDLCPKCREPGVLQDAVVNYGLEAALETLGRCAVPAPPSRSAELATPTLPMGRGQLLRTFARRLCCRQTLNVLALIVGWVWDHACALWCCFWLAAVSGSSAMCCFWLSVLFLAFAELFALSTLTIILEAVTV
ncbi:unnamed protein product [Amoebophrya sp. A120]|nr:unnamed protein product [Amoebophrya sp. A120]|eukprot:GSA120T00024849001.1